MKINPGLLKLDLFCNGLRIDKTCDLDKDARPILRTRGGLGSGLEAILPNNLYTNIPLEERFAEKSPFTLFKQNKDYYIKRGEKEICRIDLPPKPEFYDKKTSSGKLMSRIGVLQGTYLGIYPGRVCEFWRMSPKMNCKFCSVGLNVGRTEEYEKTVEDVLETVRAAKEEKKITFVHFNTGYLRGEALDMLEPYIKKVKEETGLLIGVQCPPNTNLSRYGYLKKTGADHVSFCLELFNRKRFEKICPGKHAHIGQKRYLDAMEHCVSIFGKGRVSGEIVAGLEDPEDTIKAIEHFAVKGIVPTVCIFRPCKGTALENTDPPRTEDMIPVFKKLYEACIENRIPIGIAPNIKVSLVLLPEEGRFFLHRRNVKFFIAESRLNILKFLYRMYFKTRIFLKSI